jgi:hypothetical protein
MIRHNVKDPTWLRGTLAASPVSPPRWGFVTFQRRQGLANRLRSELGEYAPQRADGRREGVAVVLDDIVKFSS